MQQKTIKRAVQFSGVALHSGVGSTIVFKPALENTGIRFVRTDLEGKPLIPAHIKNLSSSKRGTNLSSRGAEVQAVEHVLAALYGLGVDNVEIELKGLEPPAGDGSALPYVNLLKPQVAPQKSLKNYIQIKSPLHLKKEGKKIIALPLGHLKLSFVIDFPGTIVGCQRATFEEGIHNFEKALAPARTFGFLSEVEDLWREKLALGGSLDNAIVITEDGYSCELRFPNELARHKILDLLGDLALIGRPIKGNIMAIKAGHELNLRLAKAIVEQGG